MCPQHWLRPAAIPRGQEQACVLARDLPREFDLELVVTPLPRDDDRDGDPPEGRFLWMSGSLERALSLYAKSRSRLGSRLAPFYVGPR
jgi:hypothetical protein